MLGTEVAGGVQTEQPRIVIVIFSGLSCLFFVAWGKVDLLAVVCVVFCHFLKSVLVHIRIKGEVGAMKLI